MSSYPQGTVTRSNPERRVPGIDLLRGLCIIAVVLHHINLRIHFRESSFGSLIGPAANRVLFWSGYYGVRVFFVISGFLIATWSLKRWSSLNHIDLRKFYRMRFARIVPCLLGLLALLALLDRAGVRYFTINPQHTSLGRALVAALTFHINWLEARTGYLPAAWDVLWSLSVEEVFYIFFPLLCVLLRKQALMIAALLCFVVAGPYVRIHAANELWADYGYLSCMDGIAIGCLAALVATKIRLSARAKFAWAACGVLLCIFIDFFRTSAARLGLYKAGLDVTLLEIGTALLLIALQLRFEERAPENSSLKEMATANMSPIRHALWQSTGFLRWFGRNSYEVYLTHMLMVWPMVIVFQHFQWSIDLAPLWFLLTTALAGATGYLVARFYSEPLNRKIRVKSAAEQTVTEQKRTMAVEKA
ncbi:MAG TPA: acyltransferase [Candidatus Angelobacter sp.]